MNTKRFVRRALLRGAVSAAAAAAVPTRGGRTARAAAGAAGFAAGAAIEYPAVGAVAAAAAAVHARRTRTSPAPLLKGAAAGLVTTRPWPVAPRTAAQIRPALRPIGAEPTQDGEGLCIVVNVGAGSPVKDSPAERLRRELPMADVREVEADDLADALRNAGRAGRALGISGGDGSICAAAAVAHVVDRPLFVVPAGTLNHLARDLGIAGPDDAIQALRAGRTVAVDVSTIDGKTFLNTASFGAYTALVDAREKLEDRIGKWPALLVALVAVLREGEPVEVEIDGRRRRLWMIFVGNCRYHPRGFAPTWRERLDDGCLDVRLVDATAPWARTRLLLAVLTGRLGRSRIYEAFTTRELRVRTTDGTPLRLARDGETFEASGPEFVICKEERPLAVYVPVPADEEDDSSSRSRRPTTTSTTTSTTTPTPVSHGPARL